jgi:hypothetical protein
MMARATKASAPTAAEPEPAAISFSPSDAAIAAGHAAGTDVAGMLATLRLQLLEARQVLSTIIWLSPPGDDRLRPLKSLMKRLCLFMGEIDVFAP